ncbi:adenylyl-sulfate kinase [Aeromonas hydrophila]|uniref:adenylyl-sulfate kinase n=1 Tax=Aeromonas hydrophila TaxID=644 RepID=UPI001C75852F|nr:adenylyl-sulfate kinase [Aeromonas hydrophila]MCR3910154.1 adenylyl-sulfate kinase [Aeromonas hydrophila]QWL71906.1 adenylyl-sulfate kinase [Aeromonas hydrophila]
MVIWITGLSGAGKTTVGKHLVKKLRAEGKCIVHLDGDELRCALFSDITDDPHSPINRLRIAYKYSALCDMLSKQGLIVVISTISLFHEIHKWNRDNILGYYEVYLDVPLNVLSSRNQKGLYKDYAAGHIDNICGLDIQSEYPKHPDLKINYSEEIDAEENAEYIYNKLKGVINECK